MSNGSIEKRTTISVPARSGSGDSSPKSPPSPLVRSASYVQLSPEQLEKFPTRTDSLRRSFSENVLANALSSTQRRSSTQEEPSGSPDLKNADSQRRATHPATTASDALPAPSFGVDRVTRDPLDLPAAEQTEANIAKDPIKDPGKKEGNDKKKSERQQPRRSVSGTISSFARRRSWIGMPAPPSSPPSKRSSGIERAAASETEEDHGISRPTTHHSPMDEPVNSPVQTHTNGAARRNSLMMRKHRRPLSSLVNRDSLIEAPSVPPIPKSYSTDRLPTLKHKQSNLSEVPAMPRASSYERSQGSGTESPRKRDELWSVFRNLDGEFSKFQSRPSTTRTAVVRSSLLPFLKHYADHPSTSSLRPEDLDRRTVILNKWWTGLLEMLNGRYGESVSGNDRPAILEAATALMVRPEWVAAPPLHIRTARGPRASLKSRSTTSLGSTMSDFLVDSVFHNVKNTFTQNLLAQMAYVVQKMSTRNVAASVVTFCGKATAYAFFYCEGVAAILVRLWAIPTATLRCVLTEYGFSRTDKLDATCDRICNLYPLCMHPLAFKSLQSTARYLRSRPNLPIATAYIPWHGPWVSRWAGKDTDLFFVFVKHFTDLVSRCMPGEIIPEEQIVAPGWALVQAQVLTVMRSTVQRSNSTHTVDHPAGPAPTTTFEEMLGEADTTATMLPLPATGHVRSMAENRLIMLLRDCLANSTVMTQEARSMFADVFDRLLKATARKTSMFDHNACFTLCDFLEEAIAILTRYYQPSASKSSGYDWGFWFDVCKQMIQSQNSMTEVRLFAFLYSMWGSITKDDDRRHEMCIGWLLSKNTFQLHFNHWCPMVRAFFMRLLIWKVARPSFRDSTLDQTVLHALHERLQEVWQNFLYVRQDAEDRGIAPPSTAPCNPAPSRQLLIIRDDIQAVPSAMFLSFDGILSSAGNAKANPYEKHSSQTLSASNGTLGSTVEEYERSSGGGRKKWGLLRSIIPFTSSSDRDASFTKRSGYNKKSFTPDVDSSVHLLTKNDNTVPYRSLSFKFSLEWFEKNNRFPTRERVLSPPRLPPLAEEYAKGWELEVGPNQPQKPSGSAVGTSKYAGRALAEWAVLINECRSFFNRRKAEGVPSDQLVETPSLNVEPFRRI